MSDPCPVCERPMVEDSPIGPFCPHKDCPVLDDALLWYKNSKGEWKSQKWIEFKENGKTYLRLSEKEL